jgi:hypothetical protein
MVKALPVKQLVGRFDDLVAFGLFRHADSGCLGRLS